MKSFWKELIWIFIESDSPALSPVKMEVNEPCNIYLSCVEIAKIKGLTVEEVADKTTTNAKILFERAFQ